MDCGSASERQQGLEFRKQQSAIFFFFPPAHEGSKPTSTQASTFLKALSPLIVNLPDSKTAFLYISIYAFCIA